MHVLFSVFETSLTPANTDHAPHGKRRRPSPRLALRHDLRVQLHHLPIRSQAVALYPGLHRGGAFPPRFHPLMREPGLDAPACIRAGS